MKTDKWGRRIFGIGLGPITDEAIKELEFYFRLNTHDLIRKLSKDLSDKKIHEEFLEYNKKNKTRKLETIGRIHCFKFKENEVEEFISLQWGCRIKHLSKFIKQLIHFNYEKFISPMEEK